MVTIASGKHPRHRILSSSTSPSSSGSSGSLNNQHNLVMGSRNVNEVNGGSRKGSVESSVWSSLLQSVNTTTSKKMHTGKSVVVLGPPSSGKTTLVAKLQGIDAPKKGCGLEYGYVEIRDEYRDDSTHLSIYVLDGHPEHSNLLQFALNESNIQDTLCLITVSMESPWDTIEQLEYWIRLLHDHIDSLKLDPDLIKELRDKSIKKWLEYIEPGEDQIDIGIMKTSSSTNAMAAATATTPTGASNHEEIISLPSNVLLRNLGLDIVVVVTKTDTIHSIHEVESNYKDEHFDYIQHHIRSFCLQYGASLFYTSVKEDKNCDLLYKYLTHRIYGLPFRTPALVVEKDAIFVPSGWDNEKKIAILEESITSFKIGDFYGNVIQRPHLEGQGARKTHSRTELELDVEDEQKFLERQLTLLQQGIKEPRYSNSPQQPKSVSGSPRPNAANISSTNVTPKKGDPTTGSQERVLANFFNSLLSKRSPNTSSQNTSMKSNADDSSNANSPARSEVAAELDSMLSNKSTSDC